MQPRSDHRLQMQYRFFCLRCCALCPVLFSPVLGLSVSLPPVAMYALLRPQLNAAAQRKRGGKGEGEEEEGRSGKGITQAANLNAFYIALFMQAPSLPPSISLAREHE